MSTPLILALVAVVALIAVIVAASRSGPRVTHIETRQDKDSGDR